MLRVYDRHGELILELWRIDDGFMSDLIQINDGILPGLLQNNCKSIWNLI